MKVPEICGVMTRRIVWRVEYLTVNYCGGEEGEKSEQDTSQESTVGEGRGGKVERSSTCT